MTDVAVFIRSVEDVVNFINKSDHRRRQNATLVLLIALGGIFTDAYDFTSLGVGAVQLRQAFGLTPSALGTLTSIMAVGALFGGLFGGYFADRLGRFKMFFVNMLLFVVATIVAALAPNYTVLLIARFLMGIGVGLDFPVAMSFVAEYNSLKKEERRHQSLAGCGFVAGSCCYLIAMGMISLHTGNTLWRWAVGFGAISAFAVLVLRFFFMEESPLWEASRGNFAGAARILEATYHVRTAVDPGAQARFRKMSHQESWSRYKQIFAPRFRIRLLQAIFISTTQNVEYYAVGFYLPTIGLLIFGHNLKIAILGSLTFNLFGILGGGLQSRLTSRVGIRPLAIIGFCGVIVSLLILGAFGRHFSPLVGAAVLAAFIFWHAFGPGPQGPTLATLSFPTAIRGAASGFNQACQRVGAVIGFYFFPVLVGAVGLYPTLLMLSVMPAIGLAAASLIRWDPTRVDVDGNDSAAVESIAPASSNGWQSAE